MVVDAIVDVLDFGEDEEAVEVALVFEWSVDVDVDVEEVVVLEVVATVVPILVSQSRWMVEKRTARTHVDDDFLGQTQRIWTTILA